AAVGRRISTALDANSWHFCGIARSVDFPPLAEERGAADIAGDAPELAVERRRSSYSPLLLSPAIGQRAGELCEGEIGRRGGGEQLRHGSGAGVPGDGCAARPFLPAGRSRRNWRRGRAPNRRSIGGPWRSRSGAPRGGELLLGGFWRGQGLLPFPRGGAGRVPGAPPSWTLPAGRPVPWFSGLWGVA